MNNSNKNNYLIHDNGGRPFKVVINNSTPNISNVQVYKMDDWDNIIYDTEPILTFESDKVFVGNSPLIKMTAFSGGHGLNFDGNSILLHLNNHNYVFIGPMIFSFEAKSEITSYISPVGNSDVPYPYAIDKDNNYYLLIEDVVIKYNKNITSQMAPYDNPYDYYYDYHLITADDAWIPSHLPKIKYFNDIESFYIGKGKYTMTYCPKPHKKYDKLSLEDSMYIVDTSGKKTVLNKETYVNLIESFGEAHNFEPISNKKILQKRL